MFYNSNNKDFEEIMADTAEKSYMGKLLESCKNVSELIGKFEKIQILRGKKC